MKKASIHKMPDGTFKLVADGQTFLSICDLIESGATTHNYTPEDEGALARFLRSVREFVKKGGEY